MSQYFIHWVDRLQSVKVFDYNAETGALTATAAAAGKAEISIGEALTVTVDGVEALVVDSDGVVLAHRFTDKVISSDYPRLEIYRKVTSVPERIGYIAKSRDVYAKGFFEGEIPELDDQMKLIGVAAFGAGGLTAAGFQEVE